jgi:GxxExxY protein
MTKPNLVDEELTRSVIGAFFDVYNALGYGFLEHIYVRAMERELLHRRHHVARELGVCIKYKGEALAVQRLDMVVDQRLVIEMKSTQDLHKSSIRQVFNYLRATDLEVGLLLHFGPEPKFYRVVSSNVKSTIR